jgi:hypothetical protein
MLKYFAAPFILFMMSCGGTQDHSGHAGHDSAQAEAPKVLPGDPTSQLLGAYYHLKSTLVEADSVAADSAAIAFAGLATKTDVKSLQADTTLLEQLRTMLDSMAIISSDIPKSSDLTARRRALPTGRTWPTSEPTRASWSRWRRWRFARRRCERRHRRPGRWRRPE